MSSPRKLHTLRCEFCKGPFQSDRKAKLLCSPKCAAAHRAAINAAMPPKPKKTVKRPMHSYRNCPIP